MSPRLPAARFHVLALLILVLGACAGRGDERPGELPEPTALEATTENESSAISHINPDVIYYVGAAEILGQREQFQESAAYYHRAAMISDDPEIAARAVKVAAYINDEELTLAGVERWLELDSRAPEAHRYAAILYLRKGQPDQAWEHLEALISNDPTSPEIWAGVAKMLGSASSPVAAREVFQRLLDQYDVPEDEEVYRALSDLAVQLGQFSLAEQIATRSIALQPEDPAVWHWRGKIRRTLGDLDGAADDFAKAVELDPESRSLRQSYAALLAEMEDYAGALEQLEGMGGDILVVYSKALYAEADGQRDRAVEFMQELEKVESDESGRKYFLLGQLAETLERPTEEILDFYGQVRDGQHLDDAKLRSAIVLANSGELAQARVMLRKLQNGNAQTASRAYLAEAALLREADKDEHALKVYTRGIQFLPDNIDLLFGRALHAESMDLVDMAESDLRKILELQPDDPNALNALGYTLADRTDRYEEALALIERAYEQMPDEAAVVDSMGWVHFKLGNYEQALEFLQRALELDYDPEIAAHLGEVLWTLGRYEEARETWARALEQEPDAEPVVETRNRLVNE